MNNERFKFRAWDGKNMYTINKILMGAHGGQPFQVVGIRFNSVVSQLMNICNEECGQDVPHCSLMQFTGLLDKNGLKEVYEDDIIDQYGNIKGNTFEMDAGKTDFIIQGFGDKNWGATYKEAVERGCKDA